MSILPTPALIQARSKFKARDMKEYIVELGFERGVMRCIEAQQEDIVGLKQTIKEMADTMGQLVELVGQNVQVNGAIASKVDEMHRRDEKYNESVAVRSERGDS